MGFSGYAGLSANAGAFTSGTPSALEGAQVAILQETGSFSQTVDNWPAGSYALSFQAAQQANFGSLPQDFSVQVDGDTVATFTPTGSGYRQYQTPGFTVTAGSHTITFQGLSTDDRTAFIDDVRVAVPATPGAVTGFTMTPYPNEVDLSWQAAQGALSCNVYRSLAPGGEGATPFATVTATSFADTTASNGQPYYYTVTPANGSVTGTPAAEASATPSGTWEDVTGAGGSVTVTPDILDGAASTFSVGGNTTLPSGTYRAVYVGGEMTYSSSAYANMGYRVNAPDFGNGFRVTHDGATLDAPGTGTETPQPVGTGYDYGAPFSLAADGPVGVFLKDDPYCSVQTKFSGRAASI